MSKRNPLRYASRVAKNSFSFFSSQSSSVFAPSKSYPNYLPSSISVKAIPSDLPKRAFSSLTQIAFDPNSRIARCYSIEGVRDSNASTSPPPSSSLPCSTPDSSEESDESMKESNNSLFSKPSSLPSISPSSETSGLSYQQLKALNASLRKRPVIKLTGFATSEGTSNYEQKFKAVTGKGHFKTFQSGNVFQNLKFSSIGIGSYLATNSFNSVKYLAKIITTVVKNGVNVIEIPTSFNSFDVHHTIGNTISSLIKAGEVSREEIILIGKGGLIHRDNIPFGEDGRIKFLNKSFISKGLFTMEEISGRHCMSPSFLQHQLDKTLLHTGMECVDFFLIQNVELHLKNLKQNKFLFYQRLKEAFKYLESACEEKKISYYGLTCHHCCFHDDEYEKNDAFLFLERVMEVVKEAVGENHHFKLIQLPYNLSNQIAAKNECQFVNRRKMNALMAAKELGINVISSPSNFTMERYKSALESEKDFDLTNLENESEGVKALQFSRASPFLLTSFIAAKGTDRVDILMRVVKYDC